MAEMASVLIGIASILIGIAASITAYLAYRLSVHSHSLDEYKTAADWKRGLREWSNSAIAILSEAVYLYKQEPEAGALASDEHRCRCVISAVVDQGRLLLPNIPDAHWGNGKAPAYRGFRHEALDYLVAAEQVIGGQLAIVGFPSRAHALDSLRREFVSSVLELIDPASDNQSVADLIRRVHANRNLDPTVGGLLPSQSDIPGGALYALQVARARFKGEF